MNIQVKKWGNSAAVRIPRATLAAARLRIDDKVVVREEEGRIVIEAVKERAPSLDELLSRVSDDQLHDEFDFGASSGNEAW